MAAWHSVTNYESNLGNELLHTGDHHHGWLAGCIRNSQVSEWNNTDDAKDVVGTAAAAVYRVEFRERKLIESPSLIKIPLHPEISTISSRQ